MSKTPAQPDFKAMAELRYQIRRFLRFSENAARRAEADDRCAGGTNAASAPQHRRAHRSTCRKGFFITTAVHRRQTTSLSKVNARRRGVSQTAFIASLAGASICRPSLREDPAEPH